MTKPYVETSREQYKKLTTEKKYSNMFYYFCSSKIFITCNCFIGTRMLTPQKYLFWDNSKCRQIKQNDPGLNRDVIKSLMLEIRNLPKNKWYVQRSMFREKIFANWLNMSLSLRAWVESKVHKIDTHQQLFIQGFPSPRLVAKSRLKNLVCPTIYL